MSEGKRPGGLTALAVINFVFAALGVLSALGFVVILAMAGSLADAPMDETQRAQIDALQDLGKPMMIALLALTIVTSILLLAAGIGYLKQKKFLGRTLGNVYALLSLVRAVWSGVAFPEELGGGFNLGALIGLIYPVITLVLINTTFKEDLTN